MHKDPSQYLPNTSPQTATYAARTLMFELPRPLARPTVDTTPYNYRAIMLRAQLPAKLSEIIRKLYVKNGITRFQIADRRMSLLMAVGTYSPGRTESIRPLNSLEALNHFAEAWECVTGERLTRSWVAGGYTIEYVRGPGPALGRGGVELRDQMYEICGF